MSLSNQALETPPAESQQSDRDLDVTARLRQVFGLSKRELLTMEQVAADYPFPSAEAARKFVRRHVPFVKIGRRVVVDRRDFDAAIQPRKRA